MSQHETKSLQVNFQALKKTIHKKLQFLTRWMSLSKNMVPSRFITQLMLVDALTCVGSTLISTLKEKSTMLSIEKEFGMFITFSESKNQGDITGFKHELSVAFLEHANKLAQQCLDSRNSLPSLPKEDSFLLMQRNCVHQCSEITSFITKIEQYMPMIVERFIKLVRQSRQNQKNKDNHLEKTYCPVINQANKKRLDLHVLLAICCFYERYRCFDEMNQILKHQITLAHSLHKDFLILSAITHP